MPSGEAQTWHELLTHLVARKAYPNFPFHLALRHDAAAENSLGGVLTLIAFRSGGEQSIRIRHSLVSRAVFGATPRLPTIATIPTFEGAAREG